MGLGFRKGCTLYKGIEPSAYDDIENLENVRDILFKFMKSGIASIWINTQNESVSTDTEAIEKEAENTEIEEVINFESLDVKLSEISKEIFLGKIDDYKKGTKNAIKEYESLMFVINNIHKISDGIIDWNQVKKIPEPFNINELGPNAIIEKQKIDAYEPTLIEKTFKSKLEKKQEYLKLQMMNAMKKDEEIYNSWRELIDLAEDVLKGNINAYFKAIKIVNPFEELLELGIDFEFGTDDSDIIHVEYVIDSRDIVPYYKLSAPKMGHLNKVNLTREEYNSRVGDYISACAIKISREIFSITPVKSVLVHIVDHKFNTENRQSEKITVISALIDRSKLEILEIDNIKPMKLIDNFRVSINFTLDEGLQNTSRINLADL